MDNQNFIELGKRIRQKRKLKNMTQEELAESADVGTTHISHIETGATKLSIKTFILIANALDVSADDLLCDYIKRSTSTYQNELSMLLSTCNEKEIRFIYDLVNSALCSLRKRNFK